MFWRGNKDDILIIRQDAKNCKATKNLFKNAAIIKSCDFIVLICKKCDLRIFFCEIKSSKTKES